MYSMAFIGKAINNHVFFKEGRKFPDIISSSNYGEKEKPFDGQNFLLAFRSGLSFSLYLFFLLFSFMKKSRQYADSCAQQKPKVLKPIKGCLI